jgi:hemolysin III
MPIDTTSLTAAAARSAEQIFDVKRACSYAKPRLRGRLHLIWFALCVVLGPLAVVRADETTRTVALAVYASTLVGLFGTSALYHCGRWSVGTRHRLQRLDQVMIFFLIAGTATPEFLLALPGALGQVATALMWLTTIIITTVNLGWPGAPENLVGGAFILLGWAAGVALPAVWVRFGVTPVILIASGGLLYTVGAVVYHRRRPDPIPSIFGYHEVFHAFVCVAATAQFVAITLFTG